MKTNCRWVRPRLRPVCCDALKNISAEALKCTCLPLPQTAFTQKEILKSLICNVQVVNYNQFVITKCYTVSCGLV